MGYIQKQYFELQLCEEHAKLRKMFKGINKAKSFCEYLEKNDIKYDIVIKHKEVLGCDQSEAFYKRFNNYLPNGYTICKNLLVRERKGEKRCFLIITDSKKQIDLKKIREVLDSKKLEFVDEESMENLINTKPGNVSLFNMIYDKDKNVNLVIDEDLFNQISLAFHPLYNGMSLFLEPSECLKFINLIERDVNIVKIEEKVQNKVLEKNIKCGVSS